MNLSKISPPLLSTSFVVGVSVLIFLISRSTEPEMPNLWSGLCLFVAIALISASNNLSSRALLAYVRQRDNIKGLRTPYVLVPIFHEAFGIILMLMLFTLYGKASLADELALFIGIGLFLGIVFTATNKDKDVSLDIWNFDSFESGKFSRFWCFSFPIAIIALLAVDYAEQQRVPSDPRGFLNQAIVFYAVCVPIWAKKEGARRRFMPPLHDAPRLFGMLLLLFEIYVIS